MSNLYALPSDDDDRTPLPPALPPFQGKRVSRATMGFKGGNKVEADYQDLRVDDIVKLTVEGRVVGMSYQVDETTGDLVLHQSVKILHVDWESFGDDDSGVVR